MWNKYVAKIKLNITTTFRLFVTQCAMNDFKLIWYKILLIFHEAFEYMELQGKSGIYID